MSLFMHQAEEVGSPSSNEVQYILSSAHQIINQIMMNLYALYGRRMAGNDAMMDSDHQDVVLPLTIELQYVLQIANEMFNQFMFNLKSVYDRKKAESDLEMHRLLEGQVVSPSSNETQYLLIHVTEMVKCFMINLNVLHESIMAERNMEMEYQDGAVLPSPNEKFQYLLCNVHEMANQLMINLNVIKDSTMPKRNPEMYWEPVQSSYCDNDVTHLTGPDKGVEDMDWENTEQSQEVPPAPTNNKENIHVRISTETQYVNNMVLEMQEKTIWEFNNVQNGAMSVRIERKFDYTNNN